MTEELIELIKKYVKNVKPLIEDEDERIEIGVCFQTLMEKCVKYNNAYYPDLILKIFEEEK